MGLTSITIENFKGIGAPVTIPLRPITLLFGANSAGKSTVIQALQYAWEILENKNPDVDRTRLGGELIDLGGFRNLVHQRDLSRSISITIEYSGELKCKDYQPPDIYYSDLEERVRAWEGGPDVRDWLDVDKLSVRITSAWDPIASKPFLAAYEIGFGGVLFGRAEAGPGQTPNLLVNADHPFLSEAALKNYNEYGSAIMQTIFEHFAEPMESLARLVNRMTPSERDELVKQLESTLSSKLAQRSNAKEPTTEAERRPPGFELDTVVPQWGRLLTITRSTRDQNEIGQSLESEVVWVLSQLIIGAGESILAELRGLRYLGPLRAIPDRAFSGPLQPQQPRWAAGLGAWDALLRSTTHDELVEKCSDYLADTLNLGYTLWRENRIRLDAGSEILAELRLIASRYEESDGDDLRRRVIDPLDALPRVPAIQLHDERNDIDVEPMDIGVGVSQTLPVVVGAVEPNCTVFAVEQPELHIHPAVQVGLADVFLREALEEGKKARIFLLETHSEHLVLRIMRRMRETCDGQLPSTFPNVTPNHVAVLYVETVNGMSCVREMPLNNRGDLVSPWPGGFFEEDFEELF